MRALVSSYIAKFFFEFILGIVCHANQVNSVCCVSGLLEAVMFGKVHCDDCFEGVSG